MATNAPLQAASAALTNANRAARALNTSAQANTAMNAGQAPISNMNRAISANTTAANQFLAGANKLATAAALETKGNKAKLNTAQKHFTSAAINSAANLPVKAASHARMGVNALKNYIGANL